MESSTLNGIEPGNLGQNSRDAEKSAAGRVGPEKFTDSGMLIADQKLPGRSRVKDVVINGELLNRVFNVDAAESKSCSQVWATGKYTQLHLGSYENPDLKTIECLNDFENIKKIHIMLNHKVDMYPLDRHANTLTEYFCNDDLNPIVNCEKYLNL
jgi:hypothetical protein